MSRSKLSSLKEPVADVTDTHIRKGAPAKPRKKKIYCDEESVAESADSRNLPEGSISQNSVTEDGDAGNESQNNGILTPKRPRKRQKASASTQEDMRNSHADHIARQPAKKKKGKKRTRPRGPSSGNLGLATELHDLAEDIVGDDGAADDAVLDKTISEPVTTMAVMKSEPTQKVFTETRSGFKATDRTRLAHKRAQAARAVASMPQDAAQMNTIQFALKTHHCFKTVAIFLQGMFSGIALWHIVATYMLINAGAAVFMQYYFMLAFPVQCLYFFLFAISTVYALDRYDVASPTRELLVKSVSLQAGTICVLFYLCGLLVSLVMTPLDERITLLDSSAFSNVTATPDSGWLSQWTGMNVSRGVLAVLGWFVVSLRLHTDRLSKSLLKANDDILQPNPATGRLQTTEGTGSLWLTQNT